MIVVSGIIALCFLALVGFILWGIIDIVIDKFIEE